MGIDLSFKNRVKRAGRFILGTSPEKLGRILEKADTVSFDLFDSLVRRDVPYPDSVHQLVAEKFFARTGKRIPDYSLKRKQAEAAAYAHAGGREMTLREIFGEMRSVEPESRALLMKLEQETEWEVCCADPKMKEVFDQMKRAGKHVLITSDMYLPEPLIHKILDHCGYCGYENLYLSSSFGVTKASGQLYQQLTKHNKSRPGKIIHIGDNIKSDYLRARQAGIGSSLLRGQTNPLKFHTGERNETFAAACCRAFLANHKPVGRNGRDQMAAAIGYEVLGPLLVGYCRWLKAQAKRTGISKIFFLSREGRLLKNAYEELYPYREETTAYLYVSRQALQVPMLSRCRNFHDLCGLLKPLMREHTLKYIGESCHLGGAYEKKLPALGLKLEDDLFRIPEAAQEPYFHLIQELGIHYFAEQFALAKAYLSQEGFFGSIILSDIGWHGTMQWALEKYCQDEARLQGCYIGCWNPAAAQLYERLSRSGYLTSPGKNKETELLLRFSCDIMETLFSNSEGSVAAYGRKEDKIIPVRREKEWNGSSLEFVRRVQGYAMDFVKDWNRSPLYSQADMPEELVLAGLRRMLQNPSLCTVNCFKKCRFLDGTLRNMLPNHSAVWYILHPEILISDFEKSSCKLFFLKDVFKIPLPWFWLLKFVRETLKIKSSNQKIWLEQ